MVSVQGNGAFARRRSLGYPRLSSLCSIVLLLVQEYLFRRLLSRHYRSCKNCTFRSVGSHGSLLVIMIFLVISCEIIKILKIFSRSASLVDDDHILLPQRCEI